MVAFRNYGNAPTNAAFDGHLLVLHRRKSKCYHSEMKGDCHRESLSTFNNRSSRIGVSRLVHMPGIIKYLIHALHNVSASIRTRKEQFKCKFFYAVHKDHLQNAENQNFFTLALPVSFIILSASSVTFLPLYLVMWAKNDCNNILWKNILLKNSRPSVNESLMTHALIQSVRNASCLTLCWQLASDLAKTVPVNKRIVHAPGGRGTKYLIPPLREEQGSTLGCLTSSAAKPQDLKTGQRRHLSHNFRFNCHVNNTVSRPQYRPGSSKMINSMDDRSSEANGCSITYSLHFLCSPKVHTVL